jgi:hypothetical protein
MTTYLLTFANIFEAAAFKEAVQKYTHTINYFNYKSCSINISALQMLTMLRVYNVLSKDTIVKYKQVRKGITRYPIFKF